jgi:hypothetical protein
MRVKSKNNYLGWTFGGLWTLGWISVSLLAASLFNDFKMTNDRTDGKEITITQPINGKMIVKVNEPEVEYSGSLPWINIDGNGVDITRDTFRLANVRIRIEQSKDAGYHVELKKYSRGRTLADAESKAQRMVFNTSYSDSVLDLGSGIAIDKETKFRGQQAIVLIKIPTGKKIKFDESVYKLHWLNIHINEHSRWNKREKRFDVQMDDFFDYKTGVDYTMGADGILKDAAGASVINQNNDYRFEKNDSVNLEKTIEQKKQELKELEEKKNKQQTKPVVLIKKKTNNEDGAVTGGPSSEFSLIQFF